MIKEISGQLHTVRDVDEVKEKSKKLLNEPKLVESSTEFKDDEDNFLLRYNPSSEWFDLQKLIRGLHQLKVIHGITTN